MESGKSSVVEALLGHGAQVHIRGGKIGEAPLHIACRIDEAKGEQCSKYVTWPGKCPAEHSLYCKSCRMLLKSGADANLAMADGRTPIHIASEAGNIGVIRLLLENEANILATDEV